MKKIIICVALFVSALFVKDAAAQVRFNVNFNIGSQPVWGPIGYDYVEYYYLPDIEVYYYVPTLSSFIYRVAGGFILTRYLRGIETMTCIPDIRSLLTGQRAYRYFNEDRSRYRMLSG